MFQIRQNFPCTALFIFNMSEEEREIDVELDVGINYKRYIFYIVCKDGVDSGLDTSANGVPENKRALHNAMERKRRDSIKVSV